MKRLLIILAVLLSLSFLASCASQASETRVVAETDTAPVETKGTTVDKVEVLHFHGTNQCYSCITVGDFAEYTVNTYFAEEVEAGTVTFAHINGDLPENLELVQKYGATGSSIWIGVYDASGFHKEENVNVWYKIKDKEGFAAYLKGVIERRLAGDLS